jgi:hypothetical protein
MSLSRRRPEPANPEKIEKRREVVPEKTFWAYSQPQRGQLAHVAMPQSAQILAGGREDHVLGWFRPTTGGITAATRSRSSQQLLRTRFYTCYNFVAPEGVQPTSLFLTIPPSRTP